MKEKRSVGNNVLYLIKNAWKWDKVIFAQMIAYTVTAAIVPFIGILLPKLLLDELTGPRRIERFIAILVGTFIISAIVNYCAKYFDNIYSARVINIRFKYIAMLQKKAMTMDFKYTEDAKVLNELESAFTAVENNTYGIEGVYRKLFGLIGNAISFVGYIAIVFTLSPVILVYLIVNVLITYYFNLRVKKYEYSRKTEVANLDRKANYIYNTMYDFSYGKDIRIYELNNSLASKFKNLKKERINIFSEIKNREFKVALMDSVLLLIREGIIYAYLIYSILFNGMTIGNFSMYFSTINSFGDWMKSLMEDIAHIKTQCMYINDFRDFLEGNVDDKEIDTIKIPKSHNYEIEFKNVSFKYPKSERYIFKNLSLKIKKGQKLAIVGINGAGKTTLVKLMARLYEPTSGEILLNGTNIKSFKKEEYYKLFSVVFQEIKMFAMSVGENIAIEEDRKLNRNKVIEAIQKSDMKEKITALKKGIDTQVLKVLDDEGIEFSGGQNQKLALSRALYKNGGIVILDEPTAALDPKAEYEIYNRFNELVSGKTTIYISHRLSSCKFCDKIAVFDSGRIVQYGTHDELIKEKGKDYEVMYSAQAQYYV